MCPWGKRVYKYKSKNIEANGTDNTYNFHATDVSVTTVHLLYIERVIVVFVALKFRKHHFYLLLFNQYDFYKIIFI